MDTIPYELLLAIYGYLDTTDLKALSLCSRIQRELTVPTLYTHIRLSETSVASFESGCSKDRKSFVREVTFDNLRDRLSIHETIRLCRLYCNSLEMFPNLIGVHVPFRAATRGYSRSIPPAIVYNISSYPFYQNLRKLCFSTNLDPVSGGNSSCQCQGRKIMGICLTIEEVGFLSHPWDNSRSEEEILAQFPKNLEVATGFSFEYSPLELRFPLGLSKSFHSRWAVYAASTSTLKSLTLRMESGLSDEDCLIVFPQVTFLHAIVKQGIKTNLIEAVSKMCPAVEHLYFDGPCVQEQLITTSHPIRNFQCLQTVRLPWRYRPDLRLGSNSRTEGRWATKTLLCHLVKCWTGRRFSPPRLKNLRHVDFAKSSVQTDGSEDYAPVDSGSDSDEGTPRRVLRIWKPEGGTWVPDDSFTPEDPEYTQPYRNYRCH
ncbi:hypothetical protein TWF718_003468 [Orbilia javanica]|uniref:F-box domain-containing protein n=1 Tax=Orbilia javanica TaxID=47235 RepID=A0AAN8MPB1_9PEZI